MRPYQQAAARAFLDAATAEPGVRGVVSLPTGCVAGDAVLAINRAGKGYRTTLRDLHVKFNGGGGAHAWRCPEIPTKVRALCDGVFRQHPIVAVVDSGRKPVVRVMLASGKSIVLTPDHEVCVAVGAFVPAGDLAEGQEVVTNGTPSCALCGSTERVILGRYAKYRGYCYACMKRRLSRTARETHTRDKHLKGGYRARALPYHPRYRPAGVPEHHLAIEAERNGVSLDEWVRRCRHDEIDGAWFLPKGTIVHHVNGDKTDNRLQNLEVMASQGEHNRHHRDKYLHLDGGTAGRGGAIVFLPRFDRVRSVVSVGVTDTYDVVCADPHRNFVANGVVVHNCGKTRLGLDLAAHAGRTLWLAHRDELVQQPLAAYRALRPDADCGVVQAGADGLGARDLVVASVPTLSRAARLARLADHPPFDLVVADEAHHAAAASWRRTLDALGGVPVLGLSATPERTDGVGLLPTFPAGLLYALPVARAVREGWLVPPVDLAGAAFRSERVVLEDFHPERIQRRAGRDLTEADLEAALGEAAVDATVRGCRVASDAGRRSVLAFAISVRVARATAEALGDGAAWLHGGSPRAERRATLAAFRRGEVRWLVNCALFTEGTDLPNVDAVVVARPTTSAPLYVQMAGRGLRPVCGCGRILNGLPCSCAKADCLFVDLVGAHEAHGLVTADTLGDYDPGLDGASRTGGGTGAPLTVERPDNPRLARLYNYLRAVAGEGVVGSAPPGSDLVWLPVTPGRCYVLPAGRDGSVLLELAGVDDDGETWRVVREPRDRTEAPELLGVERGVEAAQTRGEGVARALRAGGVARKDAAWRGGEPSDKQLAALARWRVWQRPRTAGEAADLLDVAVARSRFGAREKGKRDAVNPWVPW